MATKSKPENSSTNRNVNNNTTNVNVNVEYPKWSSQEPNQKKPGPNWYTRTILGGIIALVLSIAGYYIKERLNKEHSTTIQPNTVPIEGKKEH